MNLIFLSDSLGEKTRLLSVESLGLELVGRSSGVALNELTGSVDAHAHGIRSAHDHVPA